MVAKNYDGRDQRGDEAENEKEEKLEAREAANVGVK